MEVSYLGPCITKSPFVKRIVPKKTLQHQQEGNLCYATSWTFDANKNDNLKVFACIQATMGSKCPSMTFWDLLSLYFRVWGHLGSYILGGTFLRILADNWQVGLQYSRPNQLQWGGGGIGSENNGKKCETINNIFVLLFLLLDGSCKFVMSCLGCGYPVPGTLDTFHQPLRYMICGDDATWMWCNPLQEHRSGGIPFSKDAVAAATGDPLQKFSAAISNLSSTHAWAETQLRRGWVLFLTQKIL